jgi:hypothetical protein
MFRAAPDKLRQLAQQASSLLGQAASKAHWLPARHLVAFAGKAQFLYLAIAPARLFLRELHKVLATRSVWGGRVRLTHQLRRDIEWWRKTPTKNNGRSIYKPNETAYLHADSSNYGWEAVMNDDPNHQAAVFGTLRTDCNTSRGKNFEQSDTPSNLSYHNCKEGKSSYTRTTPPWSPPSPS